MCFDLFHSPYQAMCGIVGVFHRDGRMPDRVVVERMRDVMVTRGPDDAGLYIAEGVALGHRRLSIIDLSPAGHQPMPNEDDSVWVVLNGEIYNFADLRVALEQAGHRFRSRSDTEVIVHGYEEWGAEGLLRRLHGMFAFGLWDARQRHLVLARDRLGKKPLFVADTGTSVYFASDIKCLWLALGDTLRLDEKAIDCFLYFYYIPQSRTIFRGVSKLPPGHWLLADDRTTRAQPYWKLDCATHEALSADEWRARVVATLGAAVGRRVVADVPLGAFLSGGVDSSLVVALLSEVSPTAVRTFSIGFDKMRYDERRFARLVSERYRTVHDELTVDVDAWQILPSLVWHFGEPFGDSSAIPTAYVAKVAREHVGVALSGDGGDEAFLGYSSYAAVYRERRVRWIPRWIRRQVLVSLVTAAYARWPVNYTLARCRSLAQNLSGDLRLVPRGDHGWAEPFRQRLYSPTFASALDAWHPVDAFANTLEAVASLPPADGWRHLVFREILPADYLVKVDVASMMHSLEVRCPFLDHEIAELSARMPLEVLLGPRGEAKHFLKQLALDYLPSEVVLRPKQGFEVPIGDWLRGPWAARVRDIVLGPRARQRGYFDTRMIDEVLRQHAAGADHTHRIWCLLWLELWHLMFVDRVLGPSDTL